MEQRTGSHERWERNLAELAEAAGITDPPVVEPIRTISPEESKGVVDRCLVERGWTLNSDESFSMHKSQREQFQLDRYVCIASYPIGGHFLESYQAEQWEALYEYWTHVFIPCLRTAGFEVADAPTRETFLAAPERWHPVDDQALRRQLTAAEADGRIESSNVFLADVCPVSPGEEVLYGFSGAP
ncbi:hypothetical protein [Ornithinimicrobium cryptoxanthini]|uniref:Uncharacterized protein n=1 Tax=Ornithinimicrobium cryptoxanthini TaxID=2934161 RepID=A0ABY4YIV3_9MICO|nr:hypothetical protein [Ornithinimicrobium cryptoxanthini]USQ76619.1 hypothetical protein NF557_01420 [Ornithinimicrobium cryptoxanthini]